MYCSVIESDAGTVRAQIEFVLVKVLKVTDVLSRKELCVPVSASTTDVASHRIEYLGRGTIQIYLTSIGMSSPNSLDLRPNHSSLLGSSGLDSNKRSRHAIANTTDRSERR